MKLSESKILKAQSVMLAAVIAGIMVFDSSKASRYYLFEFLGALFAMTLTVFGLSKMKKMT